jgi:hypothetical protein
MISPFVFSLKLCHEEFAITYSLKRMIIIPVIQYIPERQMERLGCQTTNIKWKHLRKKNKIQYTNNY